MYSYTAYGLGVHSALALPELVAGEAGADVVVHMGRVDRLPSEAASTGSCIRANEKEACFFEEEVGAFLVREGREIIVEPAPGIEEHELRLVILGPVLAALLYQQGRLVLHASAVAIGGSAVAFLGSSGWGKSTMAAVLHARGHAVVADDVLAIQIDTADPMVSPGFPQLKLWPDAAVALGYGPDTLPRLAPGFEKRALRVAHGFPQASLPLRCIYVLDEDALYGIEPLRPQEALVELVRHSYRVRMLHSIRASSRFLQCARVTKSVPIRRLRTNSSLSLLPDLGEVVEKDLAHGP